jgi:hypothetical protein
MEVVHNYECYSNLNGRILDLSRFFIIFSPNFIIHHLISKMLFTVWKLIRYNSFFDFVEIGPT